MFKNIFGKKDKAEKDEVVIKRVPPEMVKKGETELAKKRTDELARKTQPREGGLTVEETMWLLVFVLVIIAPMVLPVQLNDTQVALFIVAPVMGWFVRLVYIDSKQRRIGKIGN